MGIGLEQQSQATKSTPGAAFSPRRIRFAKACRTAWRRLRLPSIDLSAWHPADEPPVFKELKALLKAGGLLLAAAAVLALLSSLPTGTKRDLAATVISEVNTGFSQNSRHVLASLANGDEVEVRLRRDQAPERGQQIKITEHASAINDTLTYSLIALHSTE